MMPGCFIFSPVLKKLGCTYVRGPASFCFTSIMPRTVRKRMFTPLRSYFILVQCLVRFLSYARAEGRRNPARAIKCNSIILMASVEFHSLCPWTSCQKMLLVRIIMMYTSSVTYHKTGLVITKVLLAKFTLTVFLKKAHKWYAWHWLRKLTCN